MKTNKAPEKIYVVDATFPDYVDFDGSPINTKRIDDHDIEYTRTDAFIEMAVDYINEHIEYYMKKDKMCNIPLCPLFEKQSFIKGFRKHMKGK